MPEIRHYSLSDNYVSLGKISRDILHYGLLHHTKPKSLVISKCDPHQLLEMDAVQLIITPNANYVAEIVIDIQKAQHIINQSDFPIHIEILGNHMSESYKKDYTLSFRKIENIQPSFIPIKNLIWGRDAKCGTIEFKFNGTLPNKPWMYTKEINEIRFSRDSGFAIEGSASEGNDFVYKFNPWESKPINVQYDFANKRKSGKVTVPFKWKFNGKEITSIVEFTTLDIDSSIEFSTRKDLKWGINRDCGVLKVIPNQIVNNPLLYLYDRNVLKIKKDQGFSIDGAKEEGQYYVVELDPWKSKAIGVSYNFPDRPINQEKYFTFEYVYNGRVKTEKVVYNPIMPTLNIELSDIPKSICISEKNLTIAIAKIKKSNIYEADYDNIVCSVDKKELVKVGKSSDTEFKIILKGESLKQLPDEDEKVNVGFFERNQSKIVSFVFSKIINANNSDSNHIQLKAQEGLRVVLDQKPVVVYMPVDKVEVRYKIINETNHDVVITAPTELGTIAPNASIQSSVFVKPTVEEQSIQVYAEYMKPVEERYTMELREKQDIQYKREFVPSEGLFLDTKYEKQLCGTLLLKWDCDKKILASYNDTRIKLEMDKKSEAFQFLSDIDEIKIKSTDVSPKEIPIYLTCEPLIDEELVFGCKINGMQYTSSHKIKLSPKDYNIDKLSLIPFAPNGEFYLRGKEPIPIGILKVDKTWEKDGRNKYKILKWNNNDDGNAGYVIKNVDEPVESDAKEEPFILPDAFDLESDKDNNQSVFFNAYQYFIDNPAQLNHPIRFWIDRKWCIPDFSKQWTTSQLPSILFNDPDLEISIVDGNGNTCERNDDNIYCFSAKYTEDQKGDSFLKLCQIEIKNPSIINDKDVDDLNITCDNMPDLLSLSKTSLHIPHEESAKIDICMSWKSYNDIISFEIRGNGIETLKCKAELKEDRVDDIYSIDLGTSGIVVGKMRDNKIETIVLNENDRENKFETSEKIISSKIFIFDKNEEQQTDETENKNGDIIISPSVAKVKNVQEENNEIFLFCPTKFMVGLDKIPYLTNYAGERNLDKIYFNLNQPEKKEDNVNEKKEIGYCAKEYTPEAFVQNVYANIFNRIPGIDRPEIIRKIVLSYPNTYTIEDLNKLNEVVINRFSHLKGYIYFVPESDAAVAYYIQKCLDSPEETGVYKKIGIDKTRIVIYDMGAGTLDLSYVEVDKEVKKTEGKAPLVNVNSVIKRRIGIPIAGDYLTKIIKDSLNLREDEKAKKYSKHYIKNQADIVKQNIIEADDKSFTVELKGTIFELKDGKMNDMTCEKINEYLDVVVNKAFQTLLNGINEKPDRIVLSGRASMFKPLVGRIHGLYNDAEVGSLESSSEAMKTSVANGALLYNSMFTESKVRSIKSYNRYHNVGVVYWGNDENGDSCACYEPILIPYNAEWGEAQEKNGMLCLAFSNSKVVDFSNKGYSAFIIECDLPTDDIKQLYNDYYRNFTKSEYEKTDLRWAFVNEIKRYRQDGVPETKVEISISDSDNLLHVNVGNRIAENTITEKIEGNPFYDCLN